MRSIGRSLRHRNYRLFFGGQGISVLGTWLQQAAMAWLVYRLTGKPLLLGLVGFAGQILQVLVTPFAGVVADRVNRRNLLVCTQTASLLQALLLAILTLAGVIRVWEIIVLAAFMGIINGFDIPIRQSFVVDMLDDRSDLPNAIALNSMLFNCARLIGPALAGVLTMAINEGLCFGVNALSYLAVILALLAMRLPPRPAGRPEAGNIWASLAQGFRYTFSFPPIRGILLLLSLVSLMSMHMVLMPVFAKDILHGDPRTYGSLVSFVGAGALLGAVYLAARRSVVGLDRIIGIGPILLGLCSIAFAYFTAGVGITAHPTAATAVALGRPWIALPLHLPAWTALPIAWALLAGCGFAIMVQMASSNTLLQTLIDDEKRGRVMSFYALSFMGMAPFCSLMAGALAQRIGAPNTVAIGGLACMLGAVLYLSRLGSRRSLLGPIYQRLGIVASPCESESEK